MEKPDTCKLCFETFNEWLRPRVLPCGHTFCTDCLKRLPKNGALQCPKCKKNHNVLNAENLPINYDFEESLSDVKKVQAGTSRGPQANAKFTKISMVIEEQKANVHNLNLAAEEMQLELRQYDEFLDNKMKMHEGVLANLKDLTSWHQDMTKEISEEREKIRKKQAEADAYNREIKGKLPSLDNAVSHKAAATAVAELVECFADLEGWIEQCQMEFPRVKIASSQQTLEDSMEMLSSLVTKKNEAATSGADFRDLHTENDSTIVERITEFCSGPLITFDRLQQRQDYWKKQIASGQLYAVSDVDGQRRSARLSLMNGKIYLPHLVDREPPLGARKIQHSEVLKSLHRQATTAFLDVEWDGCTRGRIHILLLSDTPLARHFRTLCTGEKGPSYAICKFYDVSYCNAPNECLRCGDYEFNSGYGGALVMPDVGKNDAIYDHRCEPGIVYATPNTSECRGAQFSITTGYGRDSITSNVFGKVQDGITILATASKLVHSKDVRIVECGLVLPL